MSPINKLIGMLKAVMSDPYATSADKIQRIAFIVTEAEEELEYETGTDVSQRT
jgi:hypothetical protein